MSVEHRPTLEWLLDLKGAVADGNKGNRPKITIQDLVERLNDPTGPSNGIDTLVPSSPRSVQACFELGIDPLELQYQPPSFYAKNFEDPDVSQLRYEKNEHLRQERIRQLINTRKMLIDEGCVPPADPTAKKTAHQSNNEEVSTAVQKDRERLEVAKRRAEKEIEQMVQHEKDRQALMEKQQRKIDELDRRAQELARQKAENEKAWMTKQREFEIQKMNEEIALEKEALRLANERYRREKEHQQKLAREEKQRQKEAVAREIAARQKVKEANEATQAILDAQAAEVERRHQEMLKADAARAKRLEEEARELAAVNAEKRRAADARIANCLAQNDAILIQKRKEFEAREEAARIRKLEKEEIQRKETDQKIANDKRKAEERAAKFRAAVEMEEMRKNSIKQRAAEKERQLAELHQRRKKQQDLKKVESDFERKLRLDKVDAIQKHKCYEREVLMDKITGEYDKCKTMQRELHNLKLARKQANMDASMNRVKQAGEMDKMRRTTAVANFTSKAH